MRSLAFALLFAGFSCRPDAVHESQLKPLRLDSLVHMQAARLARSKAVLLKSGSMDGVMSVGEREVPDSARWNSNLEVFAVYYPSAWSDAHRELTFDPGSNLDVERFVFRQGPLADLRVYSLKPGLRYHRIEIHYRDSNPLLYDERRMTMNFGERDGSALLESYRVIGTSKMPLKDTIHYRVEGRIEWPR
jgi:hypothetical protein